MAPPHAFNLRLIFLNWLVQTTLTVGPHLLVIYSGEGSSCLICSSLSTAQLNNFQRLYNPGHKYTPQPSKKREKCERSTQPKTMAVWRHAKSPVSRAKGFHFRTFPTLVVAISHQSMGSVWKMLAASAAISDDEIKPFKRSLGILAHRT